MLDPIGLVRWVNEPAYKPDSVPHQCGAWAIIHLGQPLLVASSSYLRISGEQPSNIRAGAQRGAP